MKKVIVKQDDVNPMPVEIMAESIRGISEGIRKLRAGPLNEKTLLLLIQHAAPNVGGKYKNGIISQKDIAAVLEGIESLERIYLKPKKHKPPAPEVKP